MATNSKIEWTHHTMNPWRGCQKGTRVVASEVQWRLPHKWNREAEAAGERRRVFCASLADVFEDWQGPLADSRGRELFEDGDGWFSPGDDYIAMSGSLTLDHIRQRLFSVIDETPWLDWLLLTKRPENVLRMSSRWWKSLMSVPGNVWIGTSVENQEQADKRIPELLRVPAAVRFLSMEPLLGPVDFLSSDIQHAVVHQRDYYCGICDEWFDHPAGNDHCPNCGHEHDLETCPECDFSGEHEMVCPRCGVDGGNGGLSHASCCEREIEARNLIGGINWVIVGGESGPGARPCDLEWTRSIREQCKEAGVPVFVKQLGAEPYLGFSPLPSGMRVRKENHAFLDLRDKKGGDPSEWPEDLRVRELPTTTVLTGD